MKHLNDKKRIYLDNASTTPLADDVLKEMLPFFEASYGNPSSLYTSGRMAKKALEEARYRIAEVLHADREEIIFTGSGTESDNMAILGIARAYAAYGKHILVSCIEHKAVLESVKILEREGFTIEYIPVDAFGMIDVKDCISRITQETILISVMYANNEIGTIQPIRELTQAIIELKKKRAENSRSEFSATTTYNLSPTTCPILHTDACQAAGALSLDVVSLGVDCMSINGSKIYGPKGVGILFKKKNIMISPLLVGGGQEHGFRSGTENLPHSIGMASALLRVDRRREEESLRLITLRDWCITNLKKNIGDIVLNGHRTHRLPNNIHISIPFVEGESIVLMLDAYGIEVSTGSACSANDLQVSHVLTSIDQDPNLIHGSLRITLGEKTTKDDCDYFVSSLVAILSRLRSISPLPLYHEQTK